MVHFERKCCKYKGVFVSRLRIIFSGIHGQGMIDYTHVCYEVEKKKIPKFKGF